MFVVQERMLIPVIKVKGTLTETVNVFPPGPHCILDQFRDNDFFKITAKQRGVMTSLVFSL